ncbi:hypothetical protein Vafri_20083 [Volvox africanus]|uniref:Uncharacterized protein n=1 Tax=Volvox africanus TaxID=51714 RepID=A0A8J4FCS7_9CHLO|nr:hypothetical protein Vafri_20083 [Volvox africanus]
MDGRNGPPAAAADAGLYDNHPSNGADCSADSSSSLDSTHQGPVLCGHRIWRVLYAYGILEKPRLGPTSQPYTLHQNTVDAKHDIYYNLRPIQCKPARPNQT